MGSNGLCGIPSAIGDFFFVAKFSQSRGTWEKHKTQSLEGASTVTVTVISFFSPSPGLLPASHSEEAR
jgi:hypothetical protein